VNISEKQRLGLVVVFMIWGLFVIGGYYVVHKPISVQQIGSVTQASADVLLAICMSLLAGAVGRRLLPILNLSNLERLSIQAALGWGILSLIWFVVGLLGLYEWWFAYLLLVIGIVIFYKDVVAWLRESRVIREYWTNTQVFGKILALGSSILVLIQLVYALAPPIKWDTLAYHLELPRQYVAAGKFLFLVENPLWGRSQVAELLYTWAMVLRGWETATVLGWCFSVVLLLGILGIVRRYSGVTSAWVAVSALLVGYTFRGNFSWGYVDGLAALFGFAVLVTLLEAVESQETRWFLWIGVFAGLSLGVKFTNGILIPIVLLGILMSRRKFGSRWWLYFLAVCLIAFMFFLPWLFKNGLATGNPVYPHLWATESMSEDRLLYYQGKMEITPLNWHDVILPLSLTWFGVEGAEIEGIERYYADTGPLLLLFSIPGLIYRRKETKGKLVAIWLVVGWIVMVVGGRITPLLWQTRYYYSLLPAAAIAVGWGWEAIQGISAAGVRLFRVAGVLVLIVLSLAILGDTVNLSQQNPLGVILGVRSKSAYLDDMLGYYSPAMRALHELPPGSKVVFLWDERGLYAPIDTQADQLIDRFYVVRKSLGDPELILDYWREAGFTDLLIYRAGANFEYQNREAITPEDWQALTDLLGQLPTPINFGGVYELYSLTQ